MDEKSRWTSFESMDMGGPRFLLVANEMVKTRRQRVCGTFR